MYIVTGGAGFIGSAFVWYLNQQGIEDIWIVDDQVSPLKHLNLVGLKYQKIWNKDDFINAVKSNAIEDSIKAVIHMGACSATTEQNWSFLYENNTEYTKIICEWCLKLQIRFIYASSAATYGDGSLGFDDNHHTVLNYKPLNLYAKSKQTVDEWALAKGYLSKIVGLKFFNVFGPNEQHKGSMRSMVCKAVQQIQASGTLQLFQSHRDDYKDGEQVRDFIYVKDVVKAIFWFIHNEEVNGIFNLGSGLSHTWKNLAEATFKALKLPVKLEFIPMPETIRNQYQYFTQANMKKLAEAGYSLDWYPLEDAVQDYVQNYLLTEKTLGDVG